MHFQNEKPPEGLHEAIAVPSTLQQEKGRGWKIFCDLDGVLAGARMSASVSVWGYVCESVTMCASVRVQGCVRV